MSALQIVASAICFPLMLVGWALLFRQIGRFVTLYRVGQADPRRTGDPMARTWTLAKEFLGHTRMSRLPVVAVAHWFTALSFMLLFGTLVNAFGQLIEPMWRLPVVGHFPPFEWMTELFAWGGFLGILVLIAIRQRQHPRSAVGEHGRSSRFFGSTWWQAYYVEATILGVTICILLLRTLEAALVSVVEPQESIGLHFPLTGWMSGLWSGMSVATLETLVVLVAAIKIIISFAWMVTIALQPTMGVAWHRFLAFPNIWFKREASGRTALGNLKPMTMGDGRTFSMEAMEALEEDENADPDKEPVLGVGKVEDFTWKGLLDFSTCTECGRCQSQCPAWNTDKPLSPKMLVMALRDHADAKSPWLTASDEARASLPGATTALAERPLIGKTGYEIGDPRTAYNPLGIGPDGEPSAIIDEDVLWSCTTCGACVEQCPVDIEHVDHIVDMRRYQTLIESAFPSELGGLFKNLESKGNPWGMGARARLDWAKDLPFDVKILGKDVESASEVDYLFWVGCAGAYEDRAKKTTRAVAELLDTAGVTFAVLGDGETCTGDSARRAGNEMLFSMLAQQNVETLTGVGAQKIVVTCAHCFNTIKNEYPDLGGSFEVVHHTQLLNRLVRDKKLVPVARPADAPAMSSAKNAASTAATVTYHDPCYLGRHNNVYAPPRELIGALPGVELREMERSKEKSFCCGAGGARMWMEEKLGGRINMNRTEEALATGAERIAIGCPFCRVMISDGLTAKQAEGVGEDVEVVDVAQMLLAAVRRGQDEAESSDAPEPAYAGGSSTASASGSVASAPEAASAIDVTAAGAIAAAVAASGDEDSVAADAAPKAASIAEAPAAHSAAPSAGPAPTATTASEADPWDEPAVATATPEPAAAAEAEEDAAASSETEAEADPWDAPATPTEKAGASEGEPSPAKAAEAAAASTDDVDPWDAPASAPAASTEAPKAEAPTADVDPWDEPATATPAPVADAKPEPEPEPESVEAEAHAADVDPWDEPAAATPAPVADAKPEPEPKDTATAEPDTVETEAQATDVDPWDEPAAATPAPVADAKPEPETETVEAEAQAADVDPWDEPATASPTLVADPNSASDEAGEGAATERVGPPAQSDPTEDEGPEEPTSQNESVATEHEAPRGGTEASKPGTTPQPANAEELLNAPDPWD